MKLIVGLIFSFIMLLFSLPGIAQTPELRKKKGENDADYDFRSALQAYEIGVNHIHAKEIPEAIANLEKAVRLDGNNYRYRHGLGLALSINGQLEDAVVQLKESLRINPAFSEAKNLLGSVYSDLGQFDEATQCFKDVIQDKTFAQPQFAYFNLGKVKKLQEKTDEAIAAYSLASQLDPKFYRSYIALGEIYRERKDYKQMLYYYQKAEPNYPNDVSVLFNIGFAFYKLKEYSRAKAYLAQVSILFPPPHIDQPTQDMMNAIDNLMREQRN